MVLPEVVGDERVIREEPGDFPDEPHPRTGVQRVGEVQVQVAGEAVVQQVPPVQDLAPLNTGAGYFFGVLVPFPRVRFDVVVAAAVLVAVSNFVM